MTESRFPGESKLASKSRRSLVRRLALAPCAIAALALGAVACKSTTTGDTDCYRYVALEFRSDSDTFSCSGFYVSTGNSTCPKIRRVRVKVYDDSNKNGVVDPGETVFSEMHADADPASSSVTTAGASGSKNPQPGGTSWHCEVVGDGGNITSFGGTF